MRWQGSGRGGSVLVVLLVLGLGVMTSLAWQALAAQRSHRQVAERVLEDYARLAADELVRRAAAELGYRGFLPILTALRTRAQTGASLDPAQLRETSDERLAASLALVRTTFLYGTAEASLELADPLPGGDVSSWLAAELGRHTVSSEPISSLHYGADDDVRTYVFAAVRDDAKSDLVGFELAGEAIGPWVDRALERGPLLPAALGERVPANEAITVRIEDARGRQIYRWPPQPPHLSDQPQQTRPVEVSQPFGDAYSGVLEGAVVHLSLDPSLAPDLVIGGLPRSRLGQLLALLLLATALVGVAVVQWVRDRRLSRLRSDFVSQVSHELRTPLTQIRMFAETLLFDRVRSPDESRRALEIIDRESRRLGHLVDNTLRFSRQERGDGQLVLEHRELGSLVAQVAADFLPLAKDRQMRLETCIARDVEAEVDGDAVRQILLNLLDNAVKYGPASQTVTVLLEVENGDARLVVEDQGPGIAPSDRERVWRSFERLDRHRHSATAGTGIGLAVVDELVRQHGGSRSVEEASGGGARFVVTLPLVAPGSSHDAEPGGGAP